MLYDQAQLACVYLDAYQVRWRERGEGEGGGREGWERGEGERGGREGRERGLGERGGREGRERGVGSTLNSPAFWLRHLLSLAFKLSLVSCLDSLAGKAQNV